MGNQAYVFFIFILNGFLIGLIFDMFRIYRKTFKTKDLITYIQDILFWIISGVIILYSLFKFNNGELRAYIFILIFIGAVIYLILFSKLFITVNLMIIDILKKIIYSVLILPIKKITKVFKRFVFRPILFIFINFKKNMSKFKIINKKLHKNNKKVNHKKDLS